LEKRLQEDDVSRRRWFTREELEERYGGYFVEELDAEAGRLLAAQNSTLHEFADERFPTEELTETSALLRVLVRRWREGERERRENR